MNWQPPQPPMAGGHRIAERVAALERQVAGLERQLADLKRGVSVTPTGITLNTPGTMELKVAIIRLNGGSSPIIRITDQATSPAGPVTIVGPGNPTVLG